MLPFMDTFPFESIEKFPLWTVNAAPVLILIPVFPIVTVLDSVLTAPAEITPSVMSEAVWVILELNVPSAVDARVISDVSDVAV